MKVGAETRTETTENAQSQALTKAEMAGLLKEPAPVLLSEWEARSRVENVLDASCVVRKLDVKLEIGDADGNDMHSFFVFEVLDGNGEPAGQVAVDRVTGEKYHYLGEGVVDSYETFPLYNPENEKACDWTGEYAGPNHLTLTIVQQDETVFTYDFSNEISGTARISENTACSEDEEIRFLFSDDIITVAGHEVSGNYMEESE